MAKVLALSPAERILLVQDIWDSLAAHPEAIELTDAQRQELDRRLKACREDPTAGSPWKQVMARVKRHPLKRAAPMCCANATTCRPRSAIVPTFLRAPWRRVGS